MSIKLGKRAVSLYFVICLMFLVIIFRLLYITSGSYASVASVTSQRTIEVASSRGVIYDCQYNPFVNTKFSYYSVLLPDSTLLPELENTLGEKQTDEILKSFQKGQLYTVNTDITYNSESAYSYKTVKRYGDDYVCSHIIGYTDNIGADGVCGIEKAYDSLLDGFSGSLSLGYTQSGYNTVLPGCGFTVKNDNYLSSGGIVLTVDKKVQAFVEDAAKKFGIVTGACVVLNVEDNSVLASASFPDFSPYKLNEALVSPDEPFVNRALSAYPVGSIFKPFVAAAALGENVDTEEKYTCSGTITVGESLFRCYNSTAHGEIGLSEAMENSCNCYFINLGLETGKEAITSLAAEFGFGREITLAQGIVSVKGILPGEEEIDSKPALANLCFGQGELNATPLQVAAAYAAFANGGYYRTPYLLKQQIDSNGRVTAYYQPDEGEKIISEEIADKVSECLFNNIEDGLGINAKPEKCTAAGKTATAQTGRYEDGSELLDTWFAGFFPYENPEYVIVIFKEKGSTASKDCAPLFKEIADYLYVNS